MSQSSTLFLPTTRAEMSARGWREIDVLLITGDAYFDHPSHGAAVIGRVLEADGYRVGILARPDWRRSEAFKQLGRPRLFAGVTAGAVDAVVNNYTAHMAKRNVDVYAPGGTGGGRPDMATLVYANRVREAFPKLPVVLGGIEASLRRFAYFDFLKAKVRRSILVDARAEILVYGPGEVQARTIARRLAAGASLDGIPGTVRFHQRHEAPADSVALPSFPEIEANTAHLLTQMKQIERAARPGGGARFFQMYDEGQVIAEPPPSVTPDALETSFSLPFQRACHPGIGDATVPAFETVRWSLISARGCPGGCSFCGLAAHQGREVVSRPADAIVQEAARLTTLPTFHGAISDVGGPTANAYGIERADVGKCAPCKRLSCLHPSICSNLRISADPLLSLLDRIRSLPSVKHLFVASGIRHDLALKTPDIIRALARDYTGGHLKVAPEHVAPEVLRLMRKPGIELFEAFEAAFLKESRAASKSQYLVPYFIVGFVGCGALESQKLVEWLVKRGQRLRQSQTFIPLAGTTAAAMFAAEQTLDGRPLFVPGLRERKRQKQMVAADPPKERPRARTHVSPRRTSGRRGRSR